MYQNIPNPFKKIIEKEPSFVLWEYCGVKCLIQRHPYGLHLCGYIGVDKTHPMYGVNYSSISHEGNYHGGLTFSGVFDKNFPTWDIWWVGFDCAHAFDVCPGYLLNDSMSNQSSYKDIEFVKTEVEKMASELAEWRKV